MTPRELGRTGDGIVIRHARLDDAAALATLIVEAHAATGRPAQSAGQWMLDMLQRPYPTVGSEHVLVAEDTHRGRLVATTSAIPQIWTYAGIPFRVSRPELIATDPAFWGRGLMRRQLEILHRQSAAQSELAQAITGVPHVYRRFGYEYAIELGGGRVACKSHVASGPIEPMRVRPATEADLPALMRIESHAKDRSLLACAREPAELRYELRGRSNTSILHSDLLVLEADTDHQPLGLVVLGSGGVPNRAVPGNIARIRRFELARGVSWYTATRSLVQHLTGLVDNRNDLTEHDHYQELWLVLGSEHPAYTVAPGLLERPITPDAWYLRIPDLPKFLNHVAPVLEARLASSPLAAFTGDLVISFYHHGLQLSCRSGRVTASAVPHVPPNAADALFPGLTFLQLLTGYRDLNELEHAFPDCRVPRSEALRVLLNALFPRCPSWIWPAG